MLSFNKLSFWEKNTYTENIDVCIIGSGIVGLTTALNLKSKQSSLKIVVLERGYLPTGASTKNAGFMCFGSPTEIKDDLIQHSETEVWDTVYNRYVGIKELFRWVEPDAIHYEQCGSWDLLENESIHPDFIEYLNENLRKISGHENAYTEDSSIIKKLGFSHFTKGYRNRLEGAVDTGKLIQALYTKAVAMGIHFLHGQDVLSIHPDTTHPILETQYGTISCGNIVVTTNGFAQKLLAVDVEPNRAQVLVTSPIENLAIKGTFHFDKGYYYFRNVGNRILFGGARNIDFEGEKCSEFETTDNIQNRLEQLLQSHILPKSSYTVDYRWAGIMGLGQSKKPIVTELYPHIFVGVRMGGMGMAIGSSIGLQLSDLIIKKHG